ncbi:hypothetical protein K503DRAFT_774157 [Rhizopogon vinicolor AM-OR11-026]|uniref:Uncharacterized protein n=1 Tax=Rhizopogon vinicolor AM-OR11-026 TaxID=1314800 RepID=A0A1B7MQD7_9AGAM|nr:hypothetical protein K503DRAFT_774157 [Rhizopogon vinicolor AM-OR11-026]
MAATHTQTSALAFDDTKWIQDVTLHAWAENTHAPYGSSLLVFPRLPGFAIDSWTHPLTCNLRPQTRIHSPHSRLILRQDDNQPYT